MAPRSKIAQMPAEVRDWLNQALVDQGFSGYKELEALLKERGFDISHAAIHRHGQKLERKLSAIKASTEAARLIAESAPDASDHRSAAVISLVQTELFDALLNLQELEEEVDPVQRVKLMAGAARAIAEASRASMNQKRWENEVKNKLAALEAQAQKSTGKSALDQATLDRVKEVLLGAYGQ
ncbi:MAG: DUF3486 family protein [Candidatus Sericytochromatia bacterium]|nr:DUF3486 family protein [Candidatus Sericytochromatia bacterium]